MTDEIAKALKEVRVAVSKWRKDKVKRQEPYSEEVIFKIVKAARLRNPFAVTKVTGVPGYRIRQMLNDPRYAEGTPGKNENLAAKSAVAPCAKIDKELHQSKIDSAVTFTQIVPVADSKNGGMNCNQIKGGAPIFEFEISKSGDVVIRAFVATPEVLALAKETVLAVHKAGG